MSTERGIGPTQGSTADDINEDADGPTQDDLTEFEKLRKWVREDQTACAAWRTEARIDSGFARSQDQWTAEDREIMERNNKPCLTFDFTGPTINTVAGMEVSNRQEVTYMPRTTQQTTEQQPQQQGGMNAGQSVPNGAGGQGGISSGGSQAPIPGADDTGPSEIYTAAGKYFRDQCDAEDEESDAFQDCVITGMGWTETRVDYEEDPQGKIVVDRIDPLQMAWDRSATKRNLIDARRIAHIKEVDKALALEMFPGFEAEEIDANWAKWIEHEEDPHNRELARQYRGGVADTIKKNQLTVVCITWWEKSTAYKVKVGDKILDADAKQIKELRKKAKAVGVPLVEQKINKRKYKYAFLGANQILEKEDAQCQYGFRYNAITGTRDRNNRQWVGITRSMRDPQRWTNALASSVLNHIMTAGKGIMAERTAFEKPDQAEKDWANNSKITFMNTGAISGQNPKVMPKPSANLPAGTEALMQFSFTAIHAVSGVNMETLGATNRDQAASLEYQRRQASQINLAPFFDGLRRYRKEQGRLMLHLIKDYCNDGRLIRIVGPDYEKYIPLALDDSVTEFDIIVAESPSSPSQKEASWAILQQLIPPLIGLLPPAAIAEFMKASPLPSVVIDNFMKAFEKSQAEQAQQGPPPEVLKIQAEAKNKDADTALKQQELQIRGAEAQASVPLAQMELQGKQMELGDKAAQRKHDMQMRMMEARGAQQKQGMEAQKHVMGLQQTQQKHAFGMQATQQKHELGMVQQQEKHGMGMEAAQQKINGQVQANEIAAAEAEPSAPADDDTPIDSLSKGLLALGKGLEKQGEAIEALAKATMAPRVSTIKTDAMGTPIGAVSTAQTVQ